MKRLTTLLTMAITITGLGQQMPYNPDANGDDFVGVDDVLGVLGVYDTALMQPDLECDYEGTDLEQLFSGFVNGDLVMDSVYVEYFYSDSVETFVPPCPEPIFVETVLARSYTLGSAGLILEPNGLSINCNATYLGFSRVFKIHFNPATGYFQLILRDYEIAGLTPYGAWAYTSPGDFNVPFQAEWELNEDGIQVTWNIDYWAGNCESLRLIPFWHEAE